MRETEVPRPEADFIRDLRSPKSLRLLSPRVGQHDGARPTREPERNVRVLIGLAEIGLEARPRLAASQRSDHIELAFNIDICQGAWLGDVRPFLLGQAFGVVE